MSSTSSMSASAGGGNRRRGVFSLGRYHLPVVGSGSATRLSQFVQQSPSSSSHHQQQHLIEPGSSSSSSSRAVKYTPRGQPQTDTSLLHQQQQQDDELEEIAVVSVSGVQSGQLTYGSAGSSMTNGPRVVPGTLPLRDLNCNLRDPIISPSRVASYSCATEKGHAGSLIMASALLDRPT